MRHLKRCTEAAGAPSRQKACRQCSSTKVRCDLERPACGRCQARSLQCEFVRSSSAAPAATRLPLPSSGDEESSSFQDATPPPGSSDWSHSTRATTPPSIPGSERERHETHNHTPGVVQPELINLNERRQALPGTAPGTPSSDFAVRSTTRFVTRVLKSWPRLMAAHHTAQLPPPIHRLQVAEGVPTPLANCYALAKMWAGHTEGSRELVQKTLLQEIRRLPDEVR